MNTHPPELPVSGKNLIRERPRLTEIPEDDLPDRIKKQCPPCDTREYGAGIHTLWFLPEAGEELDHITGFGKKRAFNAYELTYLGLGHRFETPGGSIQTVVTRVLPICSASRGPAHAKVICEGNDAILDVLERERQIQNALEKTYNTDEHGFAIDPFLEYGASEVVLFGHTHPDLGCFFSPTDHRSNYSTPSAPMVTFVCDPIRKDMKAMVGTGCEPMLIRVLRQRPESSAPTAAALRQSSVEELWRKLSSVASALLRHNGVKGSLDCYRDWRGNTHMELRIVSRPPKRTGKR